jgi:hypothetical protein
MLVLESTRLWEALFIQNFFDQYTFCQINFGCINQSDSEEADVNKVWVSIMVHLQCQLCYKLEKLPYIIPSMPL